MKKMNHKKTAGILAALLLLATLLIPYRSVLGAPTGSARFSGTDVTLNIGDTFSIGWAISASENVLLEATFSVSPGLTVTGPITCAQGINGGTSANKVLDYSGSFAAFSGNITVRADQAGQFIVQMTEVTLVSANDSSSVTISSPAFTVYVRTKEQTEASIAEQERIRREQEAEASRQQSEAQSRAESISASASEEERGRGLQGMGQAVLHRSLHRSFHSRGRGGKITCGIRKRSLDLRIRIRGGSLHFRVGIRAGSINLRVRI